MLLLHHRQQPESDITAQFEMNNEFHLTVGYLFSQAVRVCLEVNKDWVADSCMEHSGRSLLLWSRQHHL